MDVLGISAKHWVLNEDENLKQLLREEVWYKVPLINANELHNFKDGTLVRFRGMIQDMYGPEYYLEKFIVRNESTDESRMKNGKYCDAAISTDGESIDLDSTCNITSERQSYVVTSVPGISSWVQQYESDKFKIALKVDTSQINSNSNKRTIDEVMEVDRESSVNSPSTSKKATVPSEAKKELKKTFVVSPEHLLNHPLANEKSKVCHIKVYKESDVLKLNDTYDFVGFLSVNPVTEHLFNEDDGFESQMEIQTHHPPSSLVPRIHVVYFKPLHHINPLVNNILSENVDHLSTIRKELLIICTQLLMGDSLVAEYLICNLISEIYLRRDFMPLGKFALNISNIPKLENIDYVFELYKFVELLVSKSHYLPLTLANMNTLAFTPKKDYECNRLTSGVLQLSKNTHLLLDETKLEEGKLDAAGVQGVKALANAIKNQKVLYDFNYYPIEYDCDISFLTFSEGKSMLPSDIHVPLRPDDVYVNTFSEILDAAKHFLKPKLLNDIRKYLTEARMIKYEISDRVQELVQEEFVNMRQNDNITAEDLHVLLVLARLVCISEGKGTLDTACWRKACKMEQGRKARSTPIKNERFDLKHSDSEEEFFESGKLATLLSDTEDEHFDNYPKESSVIDNNKGKNRSENRFNIGSSQKCLTSTKYEKDHENLSCYYSASHTDNFSTDEHDSLRDAHEPVSQFKDLHISDSGTDLTELANDGEFPTFLETDWHRFWSQNGEKLIWQSWVTKYSAYINPSYLNPETNSECESVSGNQAGFSGNNSADIAGSNLETSQFNFEENYVKSLSTKKDQDRSTRGATLSRFLSTSEEKISNDISEGWNPLSPLSVDCETEVERLLSSRCGSHTSTRSLRTVDSLTNVTRMTVSSLDIGSSHSSGSISSVSSVTSSSESSDIIDEDYQNQWNSLWKEHYEQVYVSQYNQFFSHDRERISALCASKESLHTQLSDNLTVTSLETLIGEDIKCNEHSISDNFEVSDAKSDSELTKNNADILLAQLGDRPSNSKPGLDTNKNPEVIVSKLDLKKDPISSLRSHLGNLKMAEGRVEESKDVEDLSNPGRDEGCYIEDTDNFALMTTMGLPTAFGKSRSKQTPMKVDRTVKAHAEVSFESAKQQVKAALDLIGAEFVENEPDKGMSGKVEYKMRHIRHQNRRLTFGSYPKHIRFDDDGGIQNEEKESTDNLIEDEVDDSTMAEDPKGSNTKIILNTNEEAPNPLNSQEENVSVSQQKSIRTEYPKNSNPEDVVITNKDNLNVLNIEQENLSENELEFNKDPSEQVRDQSDHEELDEEMIPPPSTTQKRKKKKKKIMYPPEMEANSKIKKFWPRRFSLFSKFDQGIKLDEESWYSVTPEIVAKHTADRCACGVIVDAFCGAGGNTIQFALTCNKVIAIDIDPKKIDLARNNAEVYGVSSKIDFIVGNFFHLAQTLKADAVFLSPPWGGVAYRSQTVYDLEEMLQPVGFSTLYATAEKISKNIAAFLPKNSNTATLIKMAGPGGKVEIEQDFINNKQISLTAYYNGLIKE